MNKGYLFIANSTKPTLEKANSLQPYTIGTFGYAPVNAANELGYKLFFGLNRDVAEQVECTNFDIQFYDAHIYRDVFAFKDNWIAYKNLVKLLKEHPEIDVIHCNTPIGGVLGRLCGHKFKKTVIYTAHGFHFYKGAPLKNWLLYYPIEKFLAHWTDALITINAEDFEVAKTFRYKKGGKAYFIPGVGVELDKYTIDEAVRQKVRKDLKLSDDDVAVISMGDLVDRKNYKPAIEAIAKTDNSLIHYFICGEGVERENLERMSEELGICGQIHFLGFRRDIFQLLTAADIFMLTSQQEGLPRSTMEAMVFGLPCVLSNIRGNIDLIKNEEGGYLCEPNDSNQYAVALNRLAQDAGLRGEMGKINRNSIENLSLDNINVQMREIYDQILSWGGDNSLILHSVKESINCPADAVVGIVVGDLNENKNVSTIIRALSIAEGNIHLLICGVGPLEQKLKEQAKAERVENRCHFLGFRTDVKVLYKVSDMFINASQREGLPRSTMEAMMAGLPCVVSRIRGNIDLIEDNKGGCLFSPKDYEEMAEKISILASKPELRKQYSEYNLERIKQYDIEVVNRQILGIYREVCKC